MKSKLLSRSVHMYTWCLASIVFVFLTSQSLQSQTTVGKGEVMFTGYNADAPGTLSTDGGEFSFVLLRDLDQNTVIYFTDYGWNSTSFYTSGVTNDGVIKWTVGAGGLTCGTEVKIVSQGVATNATLTASHGTAADADDASVPNQNGITFNSSGDQILAYQGTFASPTFISALQAENGAFGSPGNDRGSNLPTGLTEGTNAMSPTEIDNLQYNSTVINNTAENIRNAIATDANWTGSATPLTIGNITFTTSACFGPSNATPTDITLTPSSVNQSTTGTNSTIGTLSTTDADGSDTHTYTEVAGTGDTDNGSFNISGSTLRADGALAAGSYSVRIRTTDSGAGNLTYDKAITVTIVDNVAPNAPSTPDMTTATDSGNEEHTAGATSDNLTNDQTPTFEGTAEAGSTVKIFSNIDGQVGSGTATGGNYSITTSTLTAGAHTITATATDGVGNASGSSSGLSINIDVTQPTVVVATTSSDPTNDNPIPVTFTFNSEAENMTENDITVVNGTTGDFASADSTTFTVNITPSGNGNVQVSVGAARAFDRAGNGNTASNTLSLTYDGTAPTLTNQALAQTASNNLQITYQSNESGTLYYVVTTNSSTPTQAQVKAGNDQSGTSTNVVSSGNAAVTVTGSNQTIVLNGLTLASTTYHVFIYEEDGVGNESSVVTNSAAVDATAPTLINQALAQTASNNLRITYQSNETGTLYYVVTTNSSTPTQAQILAGNDQSGTSTNVVSSGNTAVTVTGSDQTISLNGLTLASTTYHVFIYEEDAIGNESSVVTNSAAVDATAPTLINQALAQTASNVLQITYQSNETGTLYYVVTTNSSTPTQAQILAGNDQSGTSTNVVSSGNAAVTVTGSNQTIALNGLTLASTTYHLFIYEADAAGNQSSVVTNSAAVDATAPTLINQALAQTASNTLQITYQSNESGTLYYVVTTNSSTPTQAQIKAGNDQSGNSGNVVSSGNAAVTVTGSNQTIALNGLTLASTTYHVFIYEEDGVGNESSVVTNSAAVDATAPTVSSTSPADNATGVDPTANITVTFNENMQFGTGFFQVKQTSDDVPIFSIDAANPTNTSNVASISGAVLTINPGASLSTSTGYYLFIHSGTPFLDLAGNAFTGFTASTDFNFTILTPNTAPSFTIGANQTVSQGGGAQTIAGHTTAITDNDGSTQTLTFNVANDNNGIFDVQPDINETTGNLTFTPKASTFGKATVTVSLSDDGGTASGGVDQSANQTFDIFITPDNIKINEVHASAGADAEFIEVYNTAGNATSLSGLVMVWFNGSDDLSYKDFSLSGSTNASGFYVIGETGFASKDQSWGTTSLQNGPDAVAIYVGSASDFTNGDAATTDGLVDVIVYGSSDDATLRTALGNPALQVAGSSTNSISRTPDGTGGFVAQAASPQATNDVTPPTITNVTIPNSAAKVGDAITVSITAGEAGLTLNTGTVNGVNVTGFTDGGGGSYSATYTVAEGNTDRAAGADIPVNFILTDGASNNSTAFTTAISQASDAIDANSPSVTAVGMTNAAAKVGDAIAISITASEAGLSLNTGTVNGVNVTGFTDNGGGSYSATYTVAEGNTDRAAGADVPVNFILQDAASNTSATFTTAISQASDAIDANSPIVANVSMTNAAAKVGDAITVSIAASEGGLSLNTGTVNGVNVTGFTDNGGGAYTATYTVASGNTDRAAGDDVPVNFIMADAAGNNSATFTTAISQASDAIDANAPTITNVTIPNTAAKVGDAITVSITASEAGLSLNAGQVNGVNVTGFSDDGGGSYSATYTVAEGNTDRAAGDDVPVSFILQDAAGNNSATFTTAISQASDAIDANSPSVTAVGMTNAAAKVGDAIAISITASEAGLSLNTGTVNGVNVTGFTDNGGGSYSATYTVAEGNTDRAAGADVPVNFILQDAASNTSATFTTAISQASDAIDANSPIVANVSMTNAAAKVGDAITVSIAASEGGLSLNTGTVNGVNVTGFTDNGGGAYTATYTVASGNTDRAAGDDVPVNFIMADAAGNNSATFTTAISQASDAIDANAPTITNVTIPNTAAKVGDAITVSITASEAGLSLNAGQVNGVNVTGFSDDGGGSYSATYTVVEGNTDRAAGADVPVSFILQDAAGNNSATFTTAISQASDAIDANSPSVTTVGMTNAAAKVGDAIAISITASEAGLSLNTGTVNGVNVTGFTDNGGGSYSATYTVVEGNTDRAAGDDVPVNFILQDAASNTSAAFTTAISQASDAIDANSPTVSNVSMTNAAAKVGDAITVSIAASEGGLSLNTGTVNGVNVTGFTDNGFGAYTATYTVASGNTDRAAGDDVPVNFIMQDAAGNNSATFTTAISQASDAIDANAPTITNVSIPNATAKVGDAVTVTITAGEAGLSLNTGQVNGVNVTGFSDDGGGSYSATYTVVAGHTDRAAGADVPVSFILQDAAGNNSSSFTTAISQAADVIDANLPTISSTSPLDNATDVGITGDITITFNEDIAFGTGNITLVDITGAGTNTIVIDAASPGSQASISGAVLTINPTANLELNNNYAVQIAATAIDDVAGNSFAGITDNTTLNFTTINTSIAFSSTTSSAAESTSSANLAVSLNSASGVTVTVDYTVVGTATGGGTDYTLASGTLTFNPGDVTKNITIASIIDDALDENDETVIVTLSNPTNAGLGTNTQHTYTINDNDATPTVSFNTAASNGAESVSSADLQVDLSAVSGRNVTVNYTITGTATGSGTDFTLANGALVISAGDANNNITIGSIVEDALDEVDETVIVSLSSPVNATLGSNTQHIYTINDNDATPTVSFNSTSSQGPESTSSANLQVDLSAASGQDVMVDYTVTGTATGSGTDYTLANGTLTLTAGASLDNITIASIVANNLDEDDETVIVTLSSPTNASLGTNTQHTYTILDDDTSPTIAFTSTTSSGAESVSSANLQVALSSVSGRDVTVNYTVAGTASGSGTDYTLADGTLTITASNSSNNITIASIIEDALDEVDETVIVTLSSPTNATLGTNTQHTYTITDNDAEPTVAFALATDAQTEDQPSQDIQVSLSAVSGKTVTVNYAVTGTATAGGTDHTTVGGTITFNPGDQNFQQQIVGIVDDLLDEENETIILTLSSPSNATLGGQTTHTYTITDNDAEPTVSLSVDNSSIDEASGTATLTATLSAVSGKNVDVTIGYSGTAINGTDYNSNASTTITINAGSPSATAAVIITPVNDGNPEANETIIADITNVTNGTENGTQTQTITIVDDDTPNLTFTAASSNGAESVSSAGLTVDLSIASGLTVTADYAVTGSATEGTDFTLADGTITFNPGDVQKTITIASIVDDAILEANETVIVTLSNLSNANAGTNQVHTYTITDNDNAAVTIADISQAENGGDITVTATLDNAVEGGFKVDVSTADGTAETGDSDYTAVTSQTLTFLGNAGETQTFTITPIADTKVEANETLTVSQGNLASTSLSIDISDGATVTINNDDNAAVTIEDVSGAEDGGGIMVTATLDNAVQGGFQVDVNTTDNTATTGDSDYTAVVSQTLTFAGTAGETQTFTVTPTADTKVEADESLFLGIGNLQATSHTVAVNDGALVTITNDDAATLAINDVSRAENADGGATTTYTFTTTFTGTIDQAFTVDYATQDGTATAGENDYAAATGTLNFAGTNGETQNLQVVVINDDKVELDEAFTVVLSNLQAGGKNLTITTGTGTGTITNDDAATLSIDDVTKAENADGGATTNFVFTVTLDKEVDTGLTVDYGTGDNTATTAGADYVANTNQLSFGGTAGETQTITVTVNNDDIVEADETFGIQLTNLQANGRSVTIADADGVATITNDDIATFTISDINANENGSGNEDGGPITMVVTLDKAVDMGFDVRVRSQGNTATEGTDYTALDVNLTFAGTAGETKQFTVTPTTDQILEADEDFYVGIFSTTLDNNVRNRNIDDQALVTILNDDAASLSIDDVTMNEGNSGTTTYTFTVTLTGGVDQQVTVDYATADGTATTANSDYVAATGTLTFSGADGQTQGITVNVTGDTTEEPDENFTVTLSNIVDGGKGVTLADATGSGTITNEDDNTAPTGFTVSFDDALIAASETATGTFTFAGAEVGTTYNYSISSSAGGTAVTGTGTISTATDQVTIAELSGLNDGTLTLSVTLTDGFSNESSAQTATTELDTTAPTGTVVTGITTDTGANTSDGTTSDNTLSFNGTAEAGSTVEVFIDAVSLGTTTAAAGGAWTYDHTATTLADGDYAITARATDAAGNTGVLSSTLNITVDTGIPSAVLSSSAATLVNGAFTVKVTYSEAVNGVAAADIVATNASTANFRNVTANREWEIDVTPTADGTVTVDVPANTANDDSGNANTASNTLTFTFDGTDPTVTGITRDDPTPTQEQQVDWSVVFSEAVNNVDATDFEVEVVSGSITGATVQTVTMVSASDYTVTVDRGTGEGVFRLNLKDDDSITDNAGNILGGTGTGNGDATGESYNTNNSPTALALDVTSIAENNAPLAVIGTFTSTDADAGDTFTYSLETGSGDTNNGLFTIVNGEDVLRANDPFNFEDGNNSLSIRVRTTDNKGGTFEQEFTITITDVNETATGITLSNNEIEESDDGQLVGILSTEGDPDASEAFTYELVSGTGDANNLLFGFGGANGDELRTVASTNFEDDATLSIRVRSTDSGGNSIEEVFTINVTNLTVEPLRDFDKDAPDSRVKNFFTPNGDGVNDLWIIEDILDNPINEVKVYSQAGKLIFSQRNYQNNWDGTFNGEPIPAGTYYYQINIYNGESIIEGFLTIIKN